MAKVKTKWVCQSCFYETASYLGKCPECDTWGSLAEELIEDKAAAKRTCLIDNFENYMQPQLLENIIIDEESRFSSGYGEFDIVLGSGIVENAFILLGGDPGIGKSTILLQMCGKLSEQGIKTLYVSAEESPKQIKMRAERLNVNTDKLYIFAQNNLNSIIQESKKLEPKVMIIDSIQAIYDPDITSSPGSISQLKECSNTLMHYAKYGTSAVFLIGHVTKEGAIAGPKVLEHIVDTVLYLEGDTYKSYRILRTVKNRYGSTNEIGVFTMSDKGMEEVSNPSELFLSQRSENSSPGSAIVATIEGTRPLLVEVQALVGTTSYPSPRRVANGISHNRLLQIIAVLENRVGISLSKFDVYASVVGGISIDEPSVDLGIAMAIVSSVRNVVVDKNTVIVGEIGLTGEIRAINNIDLRVNESIKQGFERIIVPSSNEVETHKANSIEIVPVNRLMESISKSMISLSSSNKQ